MCHKKYLTAVLASRHTRAKFAWSARWQRSASRAPGCRTLANRGTGAPLARKMTSTTRRLNITKPALQRKACCLQLACEKRKEMRAAVWPKQHACHVNVFALHCTDSQCVVMMLGSLRAITGQKEEDDLFVDRESCPRRIRIPVTIF